MNPKRLLAGLAMVVLLTSVVSGIELNSSEALKYYGQGTQDFRVSPGGNALIDDGTLNITNDGEAVANFSGTGIDLYKPLSVRSSGPLSVANGIELTGTSSNTIESFSTFYLSTSSGSASDIVLDPTGQVGVDSNLETAGNISVGGNQLGLEGGDIENTGDIQTGSVSDSDADNEIEFNSNRLTGLKDPENGQDAATQSYVNSNDDTIEDNQGLEEVLSLNNKVGGENINFNETSNIQASGTNAITLDNQQNIGIPNGNLTLGDNSNITNFFNQDKCGPNQAIKTVYPNGSYECNSISTTTTSAENLSETLAAGNIANQTIKFGENNEQGIQIGDSSTNTNNNTDIAIGRGAQADAPPNLDGFGNETAVGTNAVATGPDASAFGHQATASANDSVAIGRSSTASKGKAVALGPRSTASDFDAVAIGRRSTASDNDAMALGPSSTASNAEAVALGKESTASNGEAVAIGRRSTASSGEAVALGTLSTASDIRAVALGRLSEASGDEAVALGQDSTAEDDAAMALGPSSTASAARAVAIGRFANAPNPQEATFGALDTDFNGNSNRLDVNVTGNLTVHGSNLTLTDDDATIDNFFDQSRCGSGQAVQRVFPNGTYRCVDIDSAVSSSTEGLPKTLETNNTANQSIDFDGNNLDNLSELNPSGGNLLLGSNLSLDGGETFARVNELTDLPLSPVIDTWDDGDITEYEVKRSSGTFSVSSGPGLNDSSSTQVRLDSSGGSVVNRYALYKNTSFSRGDSFSGYFEVTGDSSIFSAGISFGIQNESSVSAFETSNAGYTAFLDYDNGNLSFNKDAGRLATKNISTSLQLGKTYKLDVDWRRNGSITLEAFNESGERLASLTATDSKYDSGLIAAKLLGNFNGDNTGEFDDFTITESDGIDINSDVNLQNNQLSDISRIDDFFDQSQCASDEAIKTVLPNGSYVCNSISTTQAEGLPKILETNNTANQSIEMGGNNISGVTAINSENSESVRTGGSVEVGSGEVGAPSSTRMCIGDRCV